MADQTKAEIIKGSKIGVELTEGQCTVLSGLVQVGEYADGEVVVQEGAKDDKLRIVLSGALAVAKKSSEADWMRLNVLTAGDLAGELAFLDSRPRYAALVALGPTRLFSLQRSALESLLDRDPLIVYRVMRAIARFAHEVLHRSGAQTAELTSYLFKTGAKY
jgi:CRP/FNR family transcriptional regulator, cyclic AMP receptor protein